MRRTGGQGLRHMCRTGVQGWTPRAWAKRESAAQWPHRACAKHGLRSAMDLRGPGTWSLTSTVLLRQIHFTQHRLIARIRVQVPKAVGNFQTRETVIVLLIRPL
jgi:hypothetical protein